MENRRSFIRKSGLCLVASALPLSAFSITKRKETTGETVVTLYVDTARIAKPNVNPYCSFGQPADVTNENFTIQVAVGDTVTWEGVSSNAPEADTVNIVSINHEGGKNVFGTNVLRGEGGVVTGKVTSKTEGDTYKYKISFTVLNGGTKRNGTFHIDPKIDVH